MGDLFGVGGAAQAIGNVSAAGINAAAQGATNATNVGIADKNTQFQERMSNTAYQRGTEDMKKAGINPMLAFSKGGASAPTGTTATVESPDYGKIASSLGNSATSYQNVKKDLTQKDADIAKTQAEALSEVARAESIKASTTATGASTEKTRTDTIRGKYELPAVKEEAQVRKARAGWDKSFSGWDAVTGRIFDAIGNSGKAIHNFKEGLRGKEGGSERLKYENQNLKRQRDSYRDALGRKR